LAAAVGYQVTVVDGRPAYAVPERFPQADAVIAANPENFTETLDEGASAIIMTHNYLTDQGWLKTLLPLGLPYLGLMGPRKRAEKMLEELRNEGWEPTAKQLRGLHNPVGLDLGAASPEQIALAILGEIQAVSTGHPGGSLRDRKGPIHAAREPETNPVSRVRTAEIACLTLA
jgi:xanthine dehydrogenase accessory factor